MVAQNKANIRGIYVRAMFVPKYLSPQETDNFHKMQGKFDQMLDLSNYGRSESGTIPIPSNGALVIIGTGAGFYRTLSRLKDAPLKFQSRDGGSLVVTAHLTGSSKSQTRAITASRLVRYAASQPFMPLVGAVKKNSSFKAGLKQLSHLKEPSKIYDSLKAVSFLVVQIASQAASGHPDEIFETQGTDLYGNDLFNAMLANGLIAPPNQTYELPDEDFGMGGGVNF